MPIDDVFATSKNGVIYPVVSSKTTLITKVDIQVYINEFIDNDMNASLMKS